MYSLPVVNSRYSLITKKYFVSSIQLDCLPELDVANEHIQREDKKMSCYAHLIAYYRIQVFIGKEDFCYKSSFSKNKLDLPSVQVLPYSQKNCLPQKSFLWLLLHECLCQFRCGHNHNSTLHHFSIFVLFLMRFLRLVGLFQEWREGSLTTY